MPWFLPPEDSEGPRVAATPPLPRGERVSLVDAAGWRAAEAALAADLADLAFDAGRLTERVAAAGQGRFRIWAAKM